MREVCAVEVGKFFLNIEIAIEIDVAVRRMIVPRVKIQEHLLRESRDRIRVAS